MAPALRSNGGFTLIELMIVVAIISLLAMIAMPIYASITRRVQENCTKANLKILRGALAAYAADHDGVFPTDNLQSLIDGGYINKIPYERTPPYHPGGNVVGTGTMAQQGANDGNWYFFNDPSESRYGQIIVNCNHLDLQGKPWDTL